MQSNVLESINFWKESYEGNKESYEIICYTPLTSALWDIIDVAMAYGYYLEDIAFMEEPEDFDLEKIEAIKFGCNEKGTFIIVTGTVIDDKFIPYIREQYGYLNIKFEDKKCYIDTTLYDLDKAEYIMPDWLDFLIQSFITGRDLIPEATEEYPQAEKYLLSLNNRLQEECKRKYILEHSGEAALQEYIKSKEKTDETSILKRIYFITWDELENPNPDWYGAKSCKEVRDMVKESHPDVFEKWIAIEGNKERYESECESVVPDDFDDPFSW